MFYFFKDKRVLIIGSVILGVLAVVICYFYYNNSDTIELNEKISLKTEVNEKKETNFYVDVKGAVKDPGVYLVSDGERVIDAITKAGGLSKNANTSNINLSKRLVSEMVIVVYTNDEVKKGSKKSECNTECNCEVIEINNCIESDEIKTNLININKASVSELMTLSGVGESKAQAIISYREENGSFKTIDDIKNVSGIGESLFKNIKDSITV